MKAEDSKEWAWCLRQRHLRAIEQVIHDHGFSWCSDEYPDIEILDCKGINTLAVFKFEGFEQLEAKLSTL